MVARALVRNGWAASLYSLAGHGPLSAELAKGGVSVFVPPFEPAAQSTWFARWGRLAAAAVHLFSVLLYRRPSIVHFFLPHAYLVGAPAALLARRPIRVMSRRSLNVYQAKHRILSVVERRLHRLMTAVLGNSRSVIRELKDEEGVPDRRLALIYNGIDCDRFSGSGARHAVRGVPTIENSALTLVIVANLIEYKGHLDLVEALGEAAPQMPVGWRLLVVGRDDGLGPAVKARAAEVGIAANIALLGPRNDVPDLLQTCDIGLLCSHEEGFSNSVLEAMAAGLPMVVTDVGGNAEAVVDGKTGLVVPPRHPERLSGAILQLAHDPALRARMSVAARARVREHFSLEQCVAGYERLYRTLLAGGAPSDAARIKVSGGE